MGVWIETPCALLPLIRRVSLPMWECGLKHEVLGKIELGNNVTPHVGVWIETHSVCAIVIHY